MKQPEFVKKIKKYLEKPTNQKILVGVIIAVIIAVLVGIAIWRLRFPPEIYTSRPQQVNQQQLSQIKLPEPVAQPATNQYLAGAKAILAHFDATKRNSTDSRGFYGDARRCSPVFGRDGEPECEFVGVDFIGNGTQLASYRSTVQLLWARYQYFLVTGDQEELEQALLDLDNLIINVLDSPEYYLQNQDFNCLLMHELYFSPHLDEITKSKVARLCNESEPEMHPESLWEYDQHNHPPYFVEDFLGVSMIDTSRAIDDSQRQIYTSTQLKQELDDYLVILGNGGVLSGADYSNISAEDRLLYLRREANAALDYLAASDINEGQADLYERNLVDYFLTTKESLEWALTTEGAQYDDGMCLVSVNIQAYLNNFAPGLLTDAQKQTLATKFPMVDSSSEWDCLLAADLILPQLETSVEEQYTNRLGMLMASYREGQPFGSLLGLDGLAQEPAYLYPTVRNSYLAGLLSRYGATHNAN